MNYEEIEIYGQKIKAKNYLCSNCLCYEKCKPSLHLYIKTTDSCPSKCAFCSNREYIDNGKIDQNNLKDVIKYLDDINIIHGISITGGEPFLNVKSLNETLNTIVETTKDKYEISISTNGTNLKSLLTLDALEYLDTVHISRHHYNDEINQSIFGSNIASTEEVREISKKIENKFLLIFNALLMKKYINSVEEVKKFMEYANSVGVNKVGFVSLMKINEFCNQNYINFNDIFKDLDSSFLPGNHFYNKTICECIDGVYLTENKNIVEYYARGVKELDTPYAVQLVYTSDNKLTCGFGKKVLKK